MKFIPSPINLKPSKTVWVVDDFYQDPHAVREFALKQIFGKLKRSGLGNHNTKHHGIGDEISGELTNFQFGDPIENIVLTESIKNAQISAGIDDFQISEKDLVVLTLKIKKIKNV